MCYKNSPIGMAASPFSALADHTHTPFHQGMLLEASAERAAARAMEEAAAVGLDHATMVAQEQELATLREALAFEEALRQQARLPGQSWG
jgi:hypothetical protein